MPSRNVIPKPLQKPHPPLWVASSRRETTMVGARLGMGSLGFSFETPDEAEERANTYYTLVREECYPIGKAINPALGVVSVLSCFDTDEEAIDKGRKGTVLRPIRCGILQNLSPAARTVRSERISTAILHARRPAWGPSAKRSALRWLGGGWCRRKGDGERARRRARSAGR